MSYFGKTYKFVRHENFDSFLKGVGVPDDKIEKVLQVNPSFKLVKNGDSYTSSVITDAGTKDVTFTSGVEFDDTIGPENFPVKSTYVVDGNKVTQTITTKDKGTGVFTREFDGDECVVTLKSDKWDGVAKRFYKA